MPELEVPDNKDVKLRIGAKIICYHYQAFF